MNESERGGKAPVFQTWRQLAAWCANTWADLRELNRNPRLQWVLLAVILLLGGVLRFSGINWDMGTHLHPDERFLTMVENSLDWPESLRQYFDTASNPLNPYNTQDGSYVYGLFPLVLAKGVGQLTGYTGYSGVHLAGRALSALMDLGCVLLVFLIGRRLYDARAGLLGAFLLAVSVLNIQNSHFFTVDNFTTFFVTLTIYFAVRVAQGKSLGSMLGLGLAFGMAVSCKINTLTLLLVVAAAFWLRLQRALGGWAEPNPEIPVKRKRWRLVIRLETGEGNPAVVSDARIRPYSRAAAGMLLVLLAALFAFRIAQPQAFNGPGFFGLSLNTRWLGDMAMISRLVSGQIDYPPSHQWTSREPVWYAFKNLVLWGQGLPLGLATWFGWGLMAWHMLRRRRWEHLLLWSWMTFTFFYSSVQFVKTVRYLLPIYPTMALIAAYGLLWLYDAAKQRLRESAWSDVRRFLPAGAAALGVIVALGTLLWALAFSSIYSRPVTRIAASRWMYANIAPGAAITWEEWDDPLPLNIDGHSADATFNLIKTSPYWEDLPEKREALYDWLERADYIVLSSNRLYESIPRLPLRYPMTTRYYEALFSGELGFDLVQTFTSRPSLFGVEIVDDNADETFTVYDHPKVLIFKKSERFSAEKLRELFGGFDLERVVRMMPRDAERAPNALMLDEDDWAAQQAGGTWRRIFPADNWLAGIPTVAWLVLLYLLGFIGFPYLFVMAPALRDRGYAFSKLFGLLLLGFGSWLVPSLSVAAFSRELIALVGAFWLLGALAICWLRMDDILGYVKLRWRQMVVVEVVFLSLFLAFWLVRYANPDLWHPAMGGEKPMELAYLNAIVKSESFPPYDPWFSGGYINYYYLGWVLVATIIKLTAIPTAVAFNLALPAWFAFTGVAAYGIVSNIAGADEPRRWFGRSVRYGLAAVLLVLVAGNLGEVKLLAEGWIALGAGASGGTETPFVGKLLQLLTGFYYNVFQGREMPLRPEWWYWNASRVMQAGEINEFPYFSFLYGDLHPHLMALPYTLLATGLSLAMLLRRAWAGEGVNPYNLRSWPWAALAALALTLGFLWCANTWDYPSYALLAIASLGIGAYIPRRRLDNPFLFEWLGQSLVVIAGSYLLYAPYHAHYGAAYTSVALWTGPKSSLGALLIIHALPLFVLYSAIGRAVLGRQARGVMSRALRVLLPQRRWGRSRARYALYVRQPSLTYLAGWTALGFLAVVLLLGLLLGAWAIVLALPLAVMSAGLVLRHESSLLQRVYGLLSLAGAVLVIAVEYVVLKGDIGRMNTVFKFYLQAWALWNIASACALSELFPELARWPAGRRFWWSAALALLAAGALSYPFLATPAKINDRWQYSAGSGLDGSAYMHLARLYDQDRELSLAYDARAIAWLQENVQGTPVIAEASVPPYRWGSRISINTGLPTILGWDWHQRQQRAAYSSVVVDWRLADLATLYNSTDLPAVWQIIRRYNIRYIVVGELEAAYYYPPGLAKFEHMVGAGLEVAYRDGPMTIYHVTGGG